MSSLNDFDYDNFNKNLECPVYITALQDAIMLIPCGHTISELAAKNIYQGAISTPLARKVPCPVCRTIVTAYYPNIVMRNLVQSLIGKKPEEILPNALTSLQVAETIPLPAKRARFVLSSEEWSDLKKQLHFTSTVKDSTFSKFSVYGDKDGGVCLGVFFDRKNRNYLESCGISVDTSTEYFSRPHTLKLLFQIIEKHNEIPEDYLPSIRNLVEKGNWFNVALPGFLFCSIL